MKKKLLFALAGLLAGAIILGGCSNASGGAGGNEPGGNESDGLPIADYVSYKEAKKIIENAGENETIDLYVMVKDEWEMYYLTNYNMVNAKCKINLYVKGPESVELFQTTGGITSLISVHLGENFKTISGAEYGMSTFQGYTNLKEVSLPQSITSIDDGCFQGCTSLKKIKLPDNLKTIPGYAFYGCTALEEVILPKNLESIKGSAFKDSGASNMKDILIPKSVTKINTDAFINCKAKKVIPENKEIYWEPVGNHIGYPRKVENLKDIPVDRFDNATFRYDSLKDIWQTYNIPKTTAEIKEEGYIFIEEFEQSIKEGNYDILGECDVKLFIRGDQENYTLDNGDNRGKNRINAALKELYNKNPKVRINLDIGCYNNFVYLGSFDSNILQSIKFSIDPSFEKLDLGATYLSEDNLKKIEIPRKIRDINIAGVIFYLKEISFSDMESTWVVSKGNSSNTRFFKPTSDSKANCDKLREFGDILYYELKKQQ